MAVNRGKQFEGQVRLQLQNIDNIWVYRLHDQMSGFKGSDNPCDIMVFSKPNLILIECKAIHQHRLNFKSHIRETQWASLEYASKRDGLIAGILVWFVDDDCTYYVPIQVLVKLKDEGKVSVSSDELKGIKEVREITGVKRRIFYNYNFNSLFGGW